MTDIIAIFRSRSQVIDCNQKLKSMGIPSAIINTPTEANIGCGLSLKIPNDSFERVRFVIKNSRYSAFYGFFRIQSNNNRIILGKIT